MVSAMRLLLTMLTFAIGLAVPVAAYAEGSPGAAAVATCQAEAAQLGKDAFVAKYGPTEPFGHCYAAHATATPPAPPAVTTEPTKTTTTEDPAAAACKAEYVQIGAAAFLAKYGATETYGHCMALFRGKPAEKPKPTLSPEKAAQAACLAEAKLSTAKFAAKYGRKEPFGQCVKAALAKTRR
jgi:hypothetical protein